VDQGGLSLEVTKNYANPELQKTLKRILATLKSDTDRKFISDILSGDSWKKLREYFHGSGEPMPWTCD